jgi:hypothetical protein
MLPLGDRNIARRPDAESEELEPWQEAGETWRRQKVRFPVDIAKRQNALPRPPASEATIGCT